MMKSLASRDLQRRERLRTSSRDPMTRSAASRSKRSSNLYGESHEQETV
jgi:hypothetical protein